MLEKHTLYRNFVVILLIFLFSHLVFVVFLARYHSGEIAIPVIVMCAFSAGRYVSYILKRTQRHAIPNTQLYHNPAFIIVHVLYTHNFTTSTLFITDCPYNTSQHYCFSEKSNFWRVYHVRPSLIFYYNRIVFIIMVHV